jgi:predicted amidohydrolase YtcJ
MKIRQSLVLLITGIITWSCQQKEPVNTVLYGAQIYTAGQPFLVSGAMAIANGKIVAIGASDSILSLYEPDELIDLTGKYVYPGFNDAHAHFHGYSLLQLQVDLRGTSSYEEVLNRVALFSEATGLEFIEGRGWDQNDWEVNEFPTKTELDSLFPNTPVLLKRVDGHAAIANQAALDYAGVTGSTEVVGGVFVKEKGVLTGLLIDNAVDEVLLPKPDLTEQRKAVLIAQDSMFSYGMTSLSDAGLEWEIIEMFRELQEEGSLKLRINAMVADYPEEWEHFLEKGPVRDERLQVQCFKIYMDGALGSRGALLLEPYADDPENYGLLLHNEKHFWEAARKLKKHGWQMAVHAIGDSANRFALDLCEEVLGDSSEFFRWRVEHVQIVDARDKPRFGQLGVIASVQPTHATSDMYWAENRLGEQRMNVAYAYSDLLEGANMLVYGTDFPVEDINPFKTFRASVFRQDTAGYPPGGFGENQTIDRATTIKAMTIWPAFASFEEKVKGTLAPGKFADFVVLEKDLMKVDLEALNRMKVYQTWLDGELVYQQ